MSHFVNFGNTVFDLDKVQYLEVEHITHLEFGEPVSNGYQVNAVFENLQHVALEILPTNARATDWIADFMEWTNTPYQVYDFDSMPESFHGKREKQA